MPARERVIIHADLDAFFAAAEIRRRPELRGLPVIIGGQPGGRGVVAAASYEARAYGVHSAMPVSQATRLCPDAVLLPGDGDYYRDLSRRFRTILESYSPLVEMVSVDEAYLDISHSRRTLGTPREAAARIKQDVRDDLQLVASLGVASSRLVAKIASDLDKPDGLRVIDPGDEERFLAALPVEKMPGIGPKASMRLREMGVRTLGEMTRVPATVLEPVFGRRASEVLARARGIDDRPVDPDGGPAKSVGHERTFGQDLTDISDIRREIYRLAERTGRDLRRKGMHGAVVAVKLRYADFETVGKQRRLPRPTSAHQEMIPVVAKLVEELLDQRSAPVRLLGVRMTSLTPAALQLSLFDSAAERRQHLNLALDRLAERHGPDLVVPASARRGRRSAENVTTDRTTGTR